MSKQPLIENLDYIDETKQEIKDALKSQGVDVNDNDTFRSYSDKIKHMSTANLESFKEATPKTSSQVITPSDGYDGLQQVVVNPVTSSIDENIKPQNIKKGVSILGVEGSYEVVLQKEIDIHPSTEDKIYFPDAGCDGITQVNSYAVTHEIDENIKSNNIRKDVEILGVVGNLEAYNLEAYKYGEAAQSEVVVEPTDGFDAVREVRIKPVTSKIDENIVPGNIKRGIKILDVYGTLDQYTLESYKVVTPTANHQTILPSDGYDALRRVEVEGATASVDANIIPENIREGAVILNVVGTYDGVEDLDLQDKTVNPTSEPDGITVEVDSGYDALGKVKVNPIKAWMVNGLTPDKVKKGEEILELVGTYGPTSQVKQVSPRQDEFTVYPDGNIEFLQKVIVEGVNASIDSNITPNNIKYGVTILGIEGKFDGDYLFQEKVVTASKEDPIELLPDDGYTAMTRVLVNRVTASIDYNIRPENIRKGVEILNVVGTYEPAPSQTSKYVSPKIYEQEITPDEGYGTLDMVVVGAVTAGIDSAIKSSNIRDGVTILGVEGTMEPIISQNIYVEPSVEEKVYTPAEGYNSIHTVTVNPVTASIDDKIVASNIKLGVSILGVEGTYDGGVANLQVKDVLPTDGLQDITADDGYDALSCVNVLPTPTEDIVINPSVENQTIYRNEGVFINKIDVPKVKSDIDRNIIPENIKMNMSILGVVGTYDGGINDYFGAIPAGTSACPGIAKSVLSIPETIAFSSTDASYAFAGMTQISQVPKLDYTGLTKMNGTFKDTNMSDIYQFVIPETVQEAKYIFSGCRFPEGTYDFYLPNITSLYTVFNGIIFAAGKRTTFNIEISSKCTELKGIASSTNTSNRVPGYINITSNERVVAPMDNTLAGCQGVISLICDDNIKPTTIERLHHYNSYDRSGDFKYLKVNMDECTRANNMFDGNKCAETMEFTGESRKLTTVYRMCYDDWYSDHRALKEIKGQLYGDKLTDVRQCFYLQNKLTTFNGFKNYGKGFTSTTANYNYYNLDLSSCPLTYESLINIIDGLYDLNITYGVYDADGNPGTGTLVRQTITLGGTNLAKLTAEEKAVATAKGWNLA